MSHPTIVNAIAALTAISVSWPVVASKLKNFGRGEKYNRILLVVYHDPKTKEDFALLHQDPEKFFMRSGERADAVAGRLLQEHLPTLCSADVHYDYHHYRHKFVHESVEYRVVVFDTTFGVTPGKGDCVLLKNGFLFVPVEAHPLYDCFKGS